MSVGLTVTPVLSYALAHNEIPVVTRLTVSGIRRTVAGAALRLEVADAVGPLAEPLEVLLDLEPDRRRS